MNNSPQQPIVASRFSVEQPTPLWQGLADLSQEAIIRRCQETLAAASPHIRGLGQRFAEAGYQLYLVGGSVRDACLGRPSSDLDFCTNARPEEMRPIMESYGDALWETGISFGTLSIDKGGEQLEVTTFRSDVYDKVSRKPIVQFGETLEDDLIRRDFTTNAMAVEIAAGGELIFRDPLNGLAALQAGILDTPQSPEESFGDDPLRMLRAARFVSQLGLTFAPRVYQAMCGMHGEIARISGERIRGELDKLMAGDAPWLGMDLLVDTGLADLVLPEVPALKLEDDEHAQHKDVYAHSLQVLRQAVDLERMAYLKRLEEHEAALAAAQAEQASDAESNAASETALPDPLPPFEPDLVLRWAALLHDVGKPATRSVEDGRVSFFQHDLVGSKLVRNRLRELKYPKQMIKDISQLVYLHMRFYGYAEGAWSDSAVRRYVTDAEHLLPQLHLLTRADCTTRNRRKAERLGRLYDELEQRIADLAAKEDLAKVRPALNGNEIMELLGIPAGPAVGKAWNYLKELRLERGEMTREESIAALKEFMAAQGD